MGLFISIHAPRVGSDRWHTRQRSFCTGFQSTLPVWGATQGFQGVSISPEFQSTLPVWGATIWALQTRQKVMISIHAPRVGSDIGLYCHQRVLWDFNPRSPCGERQSHQRRSAADESISIHAPRVGSDGLIEWHAFELSRISIHAPRVGSDR